MRQLRRATLFATLALSACADAAPGAVAPPSPPPAETVVPVTTAVVAAPASGAPRIDAPPETPPAPAAPSEPPAPAVDLVAAPPSQPPVPFPSISILAPAAGQVVPAAKAAAFVTKLRVRDWPVAPGGNHVCVRIDKRPCRRVTDLGKPLTLGEIDPTLDDGQHVLTVFARRGSGESVKPAGKRSAFASHSFYVGKKTPPVWKDGGPMVLFDAPEDGPAPPDGVLIDFYVANAKIARGNHVLHASVGGPGLGVGTAVVIDALTPWRLAHARPGEYVVRLSLFGYRADLGESKSSTTVSWSSVAIPGAFSEVTRSFRVTAPAAGAAR